VGRLARAIVPSVLVSALLSLALVACQEGDCPSDDSPPSAKNAPLPPGAEQVAVIRSIGIIGRNGTRTRSFETRDSPAEVLAFYKEVLVKDGWEQVAPPTGFDGAFAWKDGCRNHPAYDLLVNAKSGARTRVELRETATGP
jgi:hypothetical protein